MDKTKIEDIGLSIKAYHCLKSMGVNTLGAMMEKEISDFIVWRGLGRKTLDEIIRKGREYDPNWLR